MVYPGARSSIRFERLRDGIQDYEKINIVREKLSKAGNPESKQRLDKLNRLLETYSYQKANEGGCTELVNKSKTLLEHISIYLSEQEK